MKNIAKYYDLLIDDMNDPFYDQNPLKEYMDKWDGLELIEELQLSKDKRVLEIGVGTGRLAARVYRFVKDFVGIDISKKTIAQCKKNLENNNNNNNVKLIFGDFLTYEFIDKFDTIYSSLTFLHIKNKKKAINKVYNDLTDNGIFVLSIDKSQNDVLKYGNIQINTFPDSLDNTIKYIKNTGLVISRIIEKEFAFIITATKHKS